MYSHGCEFPFRGWVFRSLIAWLVMIGSWSPLTLRGGLLGSETGERVESVSELTEKIEALIGERRQAAAEYERQSKALRRTRVELQKAAGDANRRLASHLAKGPERSVAKSVQQYEIDEWTLKKVKAGRRTEYFSSDRDKRRFEQIREHLEQRIEAFDIQLNHLDDQAKSLGKERRERYSKIDRMVHELTDERTRLSNPKPR